jgi:hypothetical protein
MAGKTVEDLDPVGTLDGADLIVVAQTGESRKATLQDILDLLGGVQVPPGGTAGQVLTKQSATDGDTDWDTPAAVGGGSDWGTAPTVRGAQVTMGTGAANNAVIPTGVGAVAGDEVVMLCFSGYAPIVPAGAYMAVIPPYGMNGTVFRKILTATDISNGYVTVNFSGSWRNHVAMVVFAGEIDISWSEIQHIDPGYHAHWLSGEGWATPRLTSRDYLLTFVGCRGVSDSSMSIGTQLGEATASDGSATLYGYAVPANGPVKLTVNVGAAGSVPIVFAMLAIRSIA